MLKVLVGDHPAGPLGALIGKTVKTILLDKDKQNFIKFVTTEGTIAIEAEGDCCSETWFADIISPQAMLNGMINKIEYVEMPKDDSRSRQESDEIYGLKFKTDGGYTDIIFRNSSNGYYSGWLNAIEEKDIPANVEFMTITEDYSA